MPTIRSLAANDHSYPQPLNPWRQKFILIANTIQSSLNHHLDLVPIRFSKFKVQFERQHANNSFRGPWPWTHWSQNFIFDRPLLDHCLQKFNLIAKVNFDRMTHDRQQFDLWRQNVVLIAKESIIIHWRQKFILIAKHFAAAKVPWGIP